MKKAYQFKPGNSPILVSMPHNGTLVPEKIRATMTDGAKRLPDTDWFLDRLYQFVEERGYFVISPLYSRYVIDLNRPEDDSNLYPGQNTTTLCPTSQFDSSSIYLRGKEPNNSEIQNRILRYWKPYHSRLRSSLDAIKDKYGVALLFEAHSIRSRVPRFFDGQLPDFNFGNLDGKTCSNRLTERLNKWQPHGYSKVINGRFKGGYITRAYSCPSENVHTLQLELSQTTYMDEKTMSYSPTLARTVQHSLGEMFDLFERFITGSRKTCQ